MDLAAGDDDLAELPKRTVFEFDDEPVVLQRKDAGSLDDGGEVKMRPKPKVDGKEETMEFVQFPESPSYSKKGRNSAEVKRATIVGNPMFSATEGPLNPEEASGDLNGLDGLQLDMDYDQIMNYFDNLKV